MTQVEYVDAWIENGQIPYIERAKVGAVAIADSGAMGTPGEVLIFFAGDDCIIQGKGNYVYGEFDLDALSKRLHLDKKGPKAWVEVYLGMGNTLLINAKDYPALAATLQSNPDIVEEIYRKEIWMALSAENAVMSELRHRILDEEHPGHHSSGGCGVDISDMGMAVTVFLCTAEAGVKIVEMPDSKRIYLEELDATPADLCTVQEKGWAKRICVRKADFAQLMALWYPNGVGAWDWKAALDQIEGDKVWICGYGD